jgi:nitrogen regulatory protein PII
MIMKAVLIVHNVAIDKDVNEALESAGINCYTKFPNTLGRGELSEPHLSTDVWPAINCGTFVVIDQTKAKEVMETVRRIRGKLGSEGIKAFMWEIDDIT